jgi:hypothetical protein
VSFDDTLFHEAIVPVKLTSDTQIGQVKLARSYIDTLSTLIYSLSWNKNSGKGFKTEFQRGINRDILQPPIKVFDMKTILHGTYFSLMNYRIDKKVNHLPKLIIDDELVEMNFPERMDLLKKMDGKGVQFYEIIPSSETFPGGVIRIVTTVYPESKPLPEGIYKIRGLTEVPTFLALIQDNTVVWTANTFLCDVDSLGFSVNIERGDYVLVAKYSKYDGSRYIPINLTSNIDLGIVAQCDSTPIEVIRDARNSENREYGRDWTIRRVKSTPGAYFKNFDILRMLNSLSFWDLKNNDSRGLIKSDTIATIQIDGVAIEKDFADMITYLRSLPAKNVEYVETFLPTEGSPGGTINIVTASSN